LHTSKKLEIAIDAIRSFSGLPIIAQLTYSEEGTTFGDLRPAAAAEQLKKQERPGHRCKLHPGSTGVAADSARVSRCSGSPREWDANAGFPKREGDRIVYPKSSPEYFALFAREAAAMGVRILGGCCGTTPAHISAMAQAVKSLRPVKAVVTPVHAFAKPAVPVTEREPESKFWKKLQKQRIHSVRGDRSAQRNFARARLRAGRQNYGVGTRGRHRH